MPDKPKFEIVDRPAVAPRPEETLDRNNGAANELAKTTKKPSYRETLNSEADRAEQEREERILRADQAGQPVLDEANRGEEAWHKAMKNRGNEEMQRRRNGGETDIDRLRRGEVNGQPRENSPEDLAMATEIRGTADDIRLQRATEQEPTPTAAAKPQEKPESHDRLADLPNSVDA